MKRRDLFGLIAAAAVPLPAFAQPATGLQTVGVLIDGSAPHPLPAALRTAMTGFGYVEGQTIAFDVRYADGQPQCAADEAADLVRKNVDLIVAHFTPAVRAAMGATRTIPIIMAPAGAPVEIGRCRASASPAATSPASPTWRPSWAAGVFSCSPT